jgi:exonuclease SbcC
VLEAEQLAIGTPIDDAQLPARWQAIDLAARTPALTRRFEAALLVIEQRRLAVMRANQQEQAAARVELHNVLHEAELALAAGHLQEARAAADKTRALKAEAGQLPKPTVQRLSRVVQQLVELERWEKFGQQTVRVQLCERAEALLSQTLPPAAMAREVQELRAEWKKLDEQHAGVPKPLWERFDGACERAYAPAARHFAEQAALHKQARKQREDFIEAAAAHALTLLGESPDWRAIERWLREIETAWRDKALGSVEPAAWKRLDARLKGALAPARDALLASRAEARKERESLIAEAEALAAKAAERDTPSRVKELQARWQANANSIVLPQRDERALWEKFRGACNAVFDARTGSRKAEEERRHAQRRAFETLAGQLESLAHATDIDEATLRSTRHELQEQWRKAIAEHGPAPAALEARFRAARTQVEQAKKGQGRSAEAAALQALLSKERLCEEADALAGAEAAPDAAVVESLRERWSALPALPPGWEQKLLARRDAALAALDDEDARYDLADRVEECAPIRRDLLLEIELTLGLDSPQDLQPQRLAVQVKLLRDRFKRTTGGADSAAQLLVNWCALPGKADTRDLQRCEKMLASLQRRR